MSDGAIETFHVRDLPDAFGGLSVDFTALYQRHRDLVYRLALRYGSGRRSWAEDMVQDVFILALEDAKFCSGQCDPAAWLYRVTSNRCLTRLKRERLFGVITAFLSGAGAVEQRTPERACAGSQALSAIEVWFERLPATEKVVFAMHLQDAVSQTQIASILGLSKGYVSKLLTRVDSRLAAFMKELGDA
jgi:RNA polymerase sigma-70 factor (ECF subfamily)